MQLQPSDALPKIMFARYYPSTIGRFMSPDLIGGSVGSPQSWNRYSYVEQNPLRWVDPYGLKKMDPNVKVFLETVFGQNLSSVRVHQNAFSRFLLFVTPGKQDAITLGQHVFFSKDAWAEYVAKTAEGLALTGHEVVHTIQFSDIAFFAAKYLGEAIKNGAGENNKYEAPAYDLMRRILAFLMMNPDILKAIQAGSPLTGDQKGSVSSAFRDVALAEWVNEHGIEKLIEWDLYHHELREKKPWQRPTGPPPPGY